MIYLLSPNITLYTPLLIRAKYIRWLAHEIRIETPTKELIYFMACSLYTNIHLLIHGFICIKNNIFCRLKFKVDLTPWSCTQTYFHIGILILCRSVFSWLVLYNKIATLRHFIMLTWREIHILVRHWKYWYNETHGCKCE